MSNRYYRKHYRRRSQDPLAALISLLCLSLFLGIITHSTALINTSIRYIIIIFFILFAIVIIRQIFQLLYELKLSKTGIKEIDQMSGTAFEQRLMVLFRNLGYRVKHIGQSGDAGVDLIIEKNGKKTAVQAKRYLGNVGEEAVQQVHTGMDYYDCDDAIIVSNAHFTNMAQRVADKTHIELWDRNTLINVLLNEHSIIVRGTQNDSGRWGDRVATIISNWIRPNNHKIEENLAKIHEAQPQIQVISAQKSEQLLPYISKMLSAGGSWQKIKSDLSRVGWQENIINEAFYKIFNAPR